MRLRRLDLTRYGKFTDFQLDFGESQPGEIDLHIIYGLNETGKSTTLSAYLDLLYGIETRSPYGFLHPYANMRIGASIETAASIQEFVRVKKPQNSLLNSSGQPVAESTLLASIGLPDRDAYRAMFSLDDATLETGGENILASKGDLGQLLFSGSSGLADLSKSLLDIKADADKIHKVRGQNTELAALKDKLSQLKKRREEIDTFATGFAALIEARDTARSAYDDAAEKRARLKVALDLAQRIWNAVPQLTQHRELRSQFQPLADIPTPPKSWATELSTLKTTEIELTTLQNKAQSDALDLSTRLDNLVVDPVALSLATKEESLSILRARYTVAESDIPTRELNLREVQSRIDGLLAQLERKADPNPQSLLLPTATVATLRSSIAQHPILLAALDAAESELAQARLQNQQAGAKLPPQLPLAPVKPLEAAIALTRASNFQATRNLAREDAQRHQAAIQMSLAALAPWQGDIHQLHSLPVPAPAQIAHWKRTLDDIDKLLHGEQSEIDRLVRDQVKLHAEISAFARLTGVTTDQQSSEIRTARERAWATHRAHLTAATADDFEAALRLDDLSTSARAEYALDLATFRKTTQDAEVTTAALSAARSQHAVTLADKQALHAEITNAYPTLPTFLQLEPWLAHRAEALSALAALDKANLQIAQANRTAAELAASLSAELTLFEIPHDPHAGCDALLRLAQTILDAVSTARAAHESLSKIREQLAARTANLDLANEKLNTWAQAWSDLCSRSWIGQNDAPPPPATVSAILELLPNLADALKEKSGLEDRIAKMHRDRDAYSREVAATATALNLPDSPAVLETASAIACSIARARADDTLRATLEAARATLEKSIRDRAAQLETLTTRKSTMTAFFGVSSFDEVEQYLDRLAARDRLQTQLEQLETQILSALRVSSIEAAEALVDAQPIAQLEQNLTGLQTQDDQLQRQLEALFAAKRDATTKVDAVGGDGQVALLEEQRRTLLLEVEEKAQLYLKLRLGSLAADHALRLYRDKHRGEMLQSASLAFQTLSRGAYTKLITQPSKDSETLVATAQDGSSKQAADLSKGTRFQLYLALRVAGYRHFAQTQQPVPFLADDIMETFDNFRAEEALRLFAEMAKVGQVIYLTHHHHLCELAKLVCPTVKIHYL